MTFSYDSLPKTQFVDILVGTLAEPRKKYSELRICRLLHFERLLSLNVRWHLGVSELKLEND